LVATGARSGARRLTVQPNSATFRGGHKFAESRWPIHTPYPSGEVAVLERMRRALRFSSVSCLWLAVFGCQFESSRVCGDELVFNPMLNTCQCPSGKVLKGEHCEVCGVHELAIVDMCQCESGYVRAASGACEPPIEGLADACDPNQAKACGARKYDYCAPSSLGGGYCTQANCVASADCPSGYTCATWEFQPFCLRPPTGLGDKCANAAGCAGKEASFCESLMSKSCLVQNCSVAKADCIDGFECCDVTAFAAGVPNLCVPTGRCPK